MAIVTDFTVTCRSFTDGQTIPVEHTCDGADEPPVLEVDQVPEGTRSFAIVMDDPDAPKGTFTHWLLYDIPGGGGMLDIRSGRSLKNGFGRTGYGGPCPPPGHGVHRYYIKVHAVDVPSLAVKGDSRQDLEEALQTHTLATATLMGRYQRRT